MCCSISLPSGSLSYTSFLKLTGRSLSLPTLQQGTHQINLSTFSCNGTFTLKTQFTWGGESPRASERTADAEEVLKKYILIKYKKQNGGAAGDSRWDWTETILNQTERPTAELEMWKKQKISESVFVHREGRQKQTCITFHLEKLNVLMFCLFSQSSS